MIPDCSVRVTKRVFGLLNQSKVLFGGRNWSTSAGFINIVCYLIAYLRKKVNAAMGNRPRVSENMKKY
jgi:hypothetical protein